MNISEFVVSPAGHLILQFLAITHLSIIIADVPNSKLSAPKIADLTTSEPVWCAPEHLNNTFCLMLFAQRAWLTSAKPISADLPVYFKEVTAAAPVPPVPPAIFIISAPAFATPTAIVPIPSDDTSFTMTLTRAAFASWISWAKSSIEYVSWWGGGETNSTPGTPPLAAAISTETLEAGNCPPSPGLAPCPILISISSSILSAK